MVLLIPATLTFFWVVITLWALIGFKNTIKKSLNITRYLGYENLCTEAKEVGWHINIKDFLAIVIFAVITGTVLAVVFRNPLIIAAGFMGGYYLPRYLLQKYKKRQRMALMVSIPDFGRVLIARLIDHNSIVRAFEMSCQDCTGPIKTLVREFIQDVGVGMGVKPALENFKSKVAFRKFNSLAETLLIAHQEGYSSEALKALEKAVESIENDVKAIETLEITSRNKKRELVYVVLASWSFPLALSFMNTDNANVYLDTLFGKALIFSYIISTVLVLIKGDDYLSLRLDEL